MEKIEHLFVVLGEELGEVADEALFVYALLQTTLASSKLVHKTLRFGQETVSPLDGKTNLALLAAELNDQQACIELLIEAGVQLPGLQDRAAINAKKDKVRAMMERCRKNHKTIS